MKLEWTLTALNQSRLEDLKSCTTESEKQLCDAVCRKEIRETAKSIESYRRLTPGEHAVLASI